MTAEGAGEIEPPSAEAAAMLPGELLEPGELILLLLKPSPWFILLAPLKPLIVLTLLTGMAVAAGWYLPLGLTERGLALLGVGLIGARLFWQFLEWLSRVYVLTDRRMIRVQGVLRVSVFQTPLKQIQHTELIFRIRERLFGLGTLSFATAGTGSPEVHWSMIARPMEAHRLVVQAIRRYGPH